jgi:ABC-type multidrug transport system fused ATPase/permease subunit
LNGLTTETVGIYLESILTMVIGIVISLFFSWRIALVCLAVSPLLFLGGIMKSKVMNIKRMAGVTAIQNDLYKESNALLSDIIMNDRAIISFGEKNSDFLVGKFDKLL